MRRATLAALFLAGALGAGPALAQTQPAPAAPAPGAGPMMGHQHGMMGHGAPGQGAAGQGMTGGPGMMGGGMMGGGMGMGGMGMMDHHAHHNPMMQAMMQGMMLGMMGGAMMHGMMHSGMMHDTMMGEGGSMMGGPMMGGMMGGPMMGADPEPRIAQLKAALRINDAQTALWNGFADAVRTTARTLQPAYEAQRAGVQQAAPWPERMERRETLLAARLDGLKRIRAAGNALYGVLSDEQRRTFDQMAGGPMGPFGGMAMNMPGGMMGNMMGGTPAR